MFFFVLLIIPILAALGAYFLGGKRITTKEFLLQLGIQLAIAGISAAIVYHSNTSDTEIWSGRISSKKKLTVPCSHSYRCNCYQSCSSDSDGHQSCHEICSTCYEHFNDYDWVADVTTGDRIEIDRIDRQGVNEPPRWTIVKMGEPASIEHSYTNYVMASAGTLFRRTGNSAFREVISEYPRVYDYYRVNRIRSIGGFLGLDFNYWNRHLDELNADLGKKKQMNAILVFAQNQPPESYYSLEEAWKGGKKNDIVVVLGVDVSSKTIQWVNTLAWTDNNLFRVKLRDDLLDLRVLDADKIFPILRENIEKYYKRKPMSDFEYLKWSITPTLGQWLTSLIVGLLCSIGLSVFLYREDLFDEERRW